MAKKQKLYVVWKGRKTGIFESWEDCLSQTKNYPDAKFKSFKTRDAANIALSDGWEKYYGQDIFETELTEEQLALIGDPLWDSISVDAACNTQTGVVEYRGVDTRLKEELFYQGPFEDGTINVAEFLAIVHALAWCKKKQLSIPIYSDSHNALKWVKEKAVYTQLERNERNHKLFELLDRALIWLQGNTYSNPLLKWETKAWGENPADFGRK